MIGAAVTVVLALLSLQSLAASHAAFTERRTDERNAVTYRAYTGRADAVVVGLVGGPFRPPARRQRLAVRFTTAGGERVETGIAVHAALLPLARGDTFEVAYDPGDPGRAAHSREVRMLAADPRSLERRLAGPGEGGDGPAPPSYTPALLTGGLALAALAGTVLWASRRHRPAPL